MTRLRMILVLLLIGAAFFAAVPWLDCTRALGQFTGIGMFGVCTFGIGTVGQGGAPGHYLNLVVGAFYLVVASWLASTRQTRF